MDRHNSVKPQGMPPLSDKSTPGLFPYLPGILWNETISTTIEEKPVYSDRLVTRILNFVSFCLFPVISLRTYLTIVSAIAIARSLFAASPALAGQYEIIKGKGVEVCEAYEKNLNTFNPKTYPMVCEREINPRMKDFKKPDWVQPSLDQARALEFDMAKLTSQVLNQPEPKSEAEIKLRTEKDEGWPAKRWIVSVDIDNDGTPDTVLKQQDGRCESRVFGVSIAVLSKDGKHYDLNKSQYIDADMSVLVGQLNKDSKPWNRRTAGLAKTEFSGYSLYDIFLHKGVAYFDLWEMNKERLHVFLRKGGTTRKICTLSLRRH